MNDPRFLIIFSFVFLLLGLYNVYQGRKRIREAATNGITIRWYKQVSLLTGIEYVLLALVFLLSASIRTGVLPTSLNNIIFPLYLLILLSAAILAGLVIRQAMSNARKLSTANNASTARDSSNGQAVVESNIVAEDDVKSEPGDQYNKQLAEQRRERRRKAAEARRRRAGNA